MREENIKRLIESDDPVREVWRMLVELWDANQPIRDYFRLEDIVSEFEQELRNVFFEIYDYLAQQITRFPFKFDTPLIIVDGMSIREGNLLVKDLKDNGFEVLEYNYSFSTLPSTTEKFREVARFEYIEVRSGKIPSEIDFKSPVWVSFPDEILHHAAKLIPPHEAYVRTRDLLFDVLELCEQTDVTIISDHGYIIIDTVWPLAKTDMEFLREHVFGSNRYVKIDDIEARVLDKLKKLPKDIRYVRLDNEYCYVCGRYFWPIKGYGKVVAHGGLSLMECIVPKIRVRI